MEKLRMRCISVGRRPLSAAAAVQDRVHSHWTAETQRHAKQACSALVAGRILAECSEIRSNSAAVEEVVTERRLRVNEYRDEFAIAALQCFRHIDVHNVDLELILGAHGLERGQHFLAQMTVAASVQGQPNGCSRGLVAHSIRKGI